MRSTERFSRGRVVRRTFFSLGLVALLAMSVAWAGPTPVTIIPSTTTTCCSFSFIHNATTPFGPEPDFFTSGDFLWRLSGALPGFMTTTATTRHLTATGTLTLTSVSGFASGTLDVTLDLWADLAGNLTAGTVAYTFHVAGFIADGAVGQKFFLAARSFGSGGDPNDPNSLFADRFHIWGNNWDNSGCPAPGIPCVSKPAIGGGFTPLGIDLAASIPEPGTLVLLGSGLLALAGALRFRKS